MEIHLRKLHVASEWLRIDGGKSVKCGREDQIVCEEVRAASSRLERSCCSFLHICAGASLSSH